MLAGAWVVEPDLFKSLVVESVLWQIHEGCGARSPKPQVLAIVGRDPGLADFDQVFPLFLAESSRALLQEHAVEHVFQMGVHGFLVRLHYRSRSKYGNSRMNCRSLSLFPLFLLGGGLL